MTHWAPCQAAFSDGLATPTAGSTIGTRSCLSCKKSPGPGGQHPSTDGYKVIQAWPSWPNPKQKAPELSEAVFEPDTETFPSAQFCFLPLPFTGVDTKDIC